MFKFSRRALAVSVFAIGLFAHAQETTSALSYEASVPPAQGQMSFSVAPFNLLMGGIGIGFEYAVSNGVALGLSYEFTQGDSDDVDDINKRSYDWRVDQAMFTSKIMFNRQLNQNGAFFKPGLGRRSAEISEYQIAGGTETGSGEGSATVYQALVGYQWITKAIGTSNTISVAGGMVIADLDTVEVKNNRGRVVALAEAGDSSAIAFELGFSINF